MINKEEEYAKMYHIEEKLWWYRTLHRKVINQIITHFGSENKTVKILDAACGTGGLIRTLLESGYKEVNGFDYSKFAIAFAQRALDNIEFGDLKNLQAYRAEEKYDVICCMDALYFLTDKEIEDALFEFKKRLNPNGILLLNIHAFEIFSGMHDVAIGSTKRFILSDFEKYSQSAGLKITYHTYWPFLLAVPILVVRQLQKIKLRFTKVEIDEAKSDVNYPGDFLNNLFHSLMKLEERLFKTCSFGSSLFMVLKH